MTNYLTAAAKGLAWCAFWIFLSIVVWTDHVQYLQGHETTFFRHKTPEEVRIREATVQKLERQAGIMKP